MSDLFAETLNDVASGPHIGGYEQMTEALMRRLCEKGLRLTDLADRRMMARSLTTLKARARDYGLVFPDYVPMAQRKLVVFMQSGDFFEVLGELSGPVALTLGIVVTKRDGQSMCSIPAHGIDDAKAALLAAFYRVRVVRKGGRKNAKSNG